MPINYGVLRDVETDKWFFVVFGGEDGNVYESDPAFDSESEADVAALRWISDNLLNSQTP